MRELLFAFVVLSGCGVELRRDDERERGNGWDDGPAQGQPTVDPRASGVARCEADAPPIMRESFDRERDWPSAWSPLGEGESWVEQGHGFLQVEPGRAHGRQVLAGFGDVEVFVRFALSPREPLALGLLLRDGPEGTPVIAKVTRWFDATAERTPHLIAELSHDAITEAVDFPFEPAAWGADGVMWLHARVRELEGGTSVEVAAWPADRSPPKELATFWTEAAPELGALSLWSLGAPSASAGAAVRVEEIVVCPLP